MSLNAKKIFITGADGFIGSHITRRLLEDGAEVSALLEEGHELPADCKGKVREYRGDLADAGSLSVLPQGMDAVLHLAAYVHRPEKTDRQKARLWEVNVEGTRNLLEALASTTRHFIYYGSIGVYDGIKEEGKVDEDSPVKPANLYTKSKLAAEELVREYGARAEMMTTVIRLPFVYGPGNKGNILKMIKAVEKGFFVMVGNGQSRRNPVYVGNVVDATLKIAGNKKADKQVYILTDGTDYTVRQLYEAIARPMGRGGRPFQIPLSAARVLARAGDVLSAISGGRFPFDSELLERFWRQRTFSSKKIRDELGFTPESDLSGRMEETVRWFMDVYRGKGKLKG